MLYIYLNVPLYRVFTSKQMVTVVLATVAHDLYINSKPALCLKHNIQKPNVFKSSCFEKGYTDIKRI